MAARTQFLSACLIFSFLVCSGYSAIFALFSVNPNQNHKIRNIKGPNEILTLTYFTSYQQEGNIILSQFQSLGDHSKQNILESSVKILRVNQNLDDFNLESLTNDKDQAFFKQSNEANTLGQINNQEKFIISQIIKKQQMQISQNFFLTQNNLSNITIKKLENSQNTSQNALTSLQIEQTSQQQSPKQGKILSHQKDGKIYNILQIPRLPKQISKEYPYMYFDDVGFYHNIPNQFIDGEVYRFSGIIKNEKFLNQNKRPKIYIVFLGKNVNYKNVCVSPILYSLEFNISCQMKNPGNYSISVIVGKKMTTSPILTKVISSQILPKLQIYQNQDPVPQGLRIQLINNSLFFLWNSRASLTNLTIFQKKSNGTIIKKQYLLSNYHSMFQVPFEDFSNFQPTTTYAQISHAKSLNGSLNIIYTKYTNKKSQITFNAVDHAFDEISQKVLMEPELPWRVEVGQKIKVNLTINQQIRNSLYITRPDLRLQRILIIKESNTSNFIKAGSQLNLQFSFSRPGTHIIQINNIGGIAVLNRPIYVGSGYPLIPDFKDMATESQILRNTQEIEKIYQKYYQKTTEKLEKRQPPKNSSILPKREYLLSLTNGLRKKYNSSEIMIDESLNKIAQSHSDDMVARNFFGHTNPDGNNVKQRAKKNNFTLLVNQNVAKSLFLTQIHLNLQRSAVHLQNKINKIWTRVGIGISMNKNKQYLATYIFSIRDLSKFPLTQKQYLKFQYELVEAIKEKNSKKRNIRENKQLSQDIKEWIQSDTTVPLTKYLDQKKKYGNMSGILIKVGYTDDWIDKLKEGNLLQLGLLSNQFGVSLGMKKENRGLLETYIVIL